MYMHIIYPSMYTSSFVIKSDILFATAFCYLELMSYQHAGSSWAPSTTCTLTHKEVVHKEYNNSGAYFLQQVGDTTPLEWLSLFDSSSGLPFSK